MEEKNSSPENKPLKGSPETMSGQAADPIHIDSDANVPPLEPNTKENATNKENNSASAPHKNDMSHLNVNVNDNSSNATANEGELKRKKKRKKEVQLDPIKAAAMNHLQKYNAEKSYFGFNVVEDSWLYLGENIINDCLERPLVSHNME